MDVGRMKIYWEADHYTSFTVHVVSTIAPALLYMLSVKQGGAITSVLRR